MQCVTLFASYLNRAPTVRERVLLTLPADATRSFTVATRTDTTLQARQQPDQRSPMRLGGMG